MTSRPAVLLVEDDAHYRRVVSLMLEAKFAVHATALARAALTWLGDGLTPDVAIVDLGLPDADGVDLVHSIRVARPELPVIVLTISDTRDRVLAAIAGGADGYVLKEGAAHELLPAIDVVLGGAVSLSPRAAVHVVEAMRTSREPDPPPILLTRMERHVLDELARGLSYAQIGLVLDISINTVRSRIRTLFAKLDVASSTEAIAVAHRRGLLRMEGWRRSDQTGGV